MSKHTPGPWMADSYDDILGVTIIDILDKNGFTVATTGSQAVLKRRAARVTSRTREQSELEANARLIVAAPELLEALKSAFALISVYSETLGIDPKHAATLKAAREAIAKAEGKK